MSIFDWVKPILRFVMIIWTAIRTRPKVKYMSEEYSFISVTKDYLKVTPGGLLRNDGEKQTTIQDAWIELTISSRTYILICERGWEPEFIGQQILGNGGQIEVYPDFIIPVTYIRNELNLKNTSATLIIQIWLKAMIRHKLELRLIQK